MTFSEAESLKLKRAVGAWFQLLFNLLIIWNRVYALENLLGKTLKTYVMCIGFCNH